MEDSLTSIPQQITLQFTVTPDDVVDATRAYYKHRTRSSMLVGAAAVIGGTAAWLLADVSVGLLLVAIGLVAMASPFLRAVDRALARAQPQARIGSTCEMEFTDDGLRFSQDGVVGLIKWSAVTEIREGEGAILLLHDRTILAALPKRAFETAAQMEVARTLLHARVAPEPTESARHPG
jgi:hypothetical protein